MRIGVIGSGDVGRALAEGLAREGHQVTLGTREPDRATLVAWRKESASGVTLGTNADAARHGELVLLAVQGSGAESAIDAAGTSTLEGKLLLDVTNPLDFSHGMPPGLFVGTSDSLGERLQRKLPATHVVKALNTVPNSRMVRPAFTKGTATMLIAGNDAGAKERATTFLRSLGWTDVVDVGGIDGARWLEALVPLWVRVGVATGTFQHAFGVLRE